MRGTPQNMLPILRQWMDDKEERKQLTDYLLKESRLPGPRANLELSGAFAGLFAHSGVTDNAWELLLNWTYLANVTEEVDGSQEFLPFCAVQACGAYYGYAGTGRRKIIEDRLKTAMNDSRWRVREAAAIGLQSIGEFDFVLLRQLLDRWRQGANELEQRAFMAALAHPPLLRVQDNVLYSLELASDIMEGIIAGRVQGNPESFRVLSKGLEYSLSVFVAAEPEAGFAMLRRFTESKDARILKIVKSNLGKTRLTKKFGPQVADLLTALTMV